jgi:hypothetical protein
MSKSMRMISLIAFELNFNIDLLNKMVYTLLSYSPNILLVHYHAIEALVSFSIS